MARKKRNDSLIVYWVVVRDQSGAVVNASSFTDFKKATLEKMSLDEAPDPEGMECTVAIEHYVHPDSPYKH